MRSNPYVRMAFIAGGTIAAGSYGGPLASVGASAALGAYATKLDGGSSLDALRAGVIGGVSSYVGGQVGGAVGGQLGNGAVGGFVGAAAGGAASGAISSTLSGGDPGQGALYGAAGYAVAAAISSGAAAVYEYYAAKDAMMTQDLRMNLAEGGENLSTFKCTSGTCPSLSAATSHRSSVGPRVTFENKGTSIIEFILDAGHYNQPGYHRNPHFAPDQNLSPIASTLFRLGARQTVPRIPYGQYPSTGGYFRLSGNGWTGDFSGWTPRDQRTYP